MRQEPTSRQVREVLARTAREARRLWNEITGPGRARLRHASGPAARRLRAGWSRLREKGRRLPRPTLLQSFAAGFGVLVAVAVAWERCGVSGCPDVDTLVSFQPGNAPLLLDRHGEEIARLRPGDRIPISLDSVPLHVQDAIVAVEDHRFRSHGGVDWLRVPGALLANIRAGGIRQGFSTIPMQLARNAFPERLPGSERTLRRKLLEIRVAGDIEERFTKDEILELYLNHVYLGDGLHGIRAAARHWFGKAPDHLTLAEGALLAALLRAPEIYHPRRHPELARERRNRALDRMVEAEVVDSAEAARAAAADLGVSPAPFGLTRRLAEVPRAGWFVDHVRGVVEEHFGERMYSMPMRIQTTLDLRAQAALEEELNRQIRWVEAGGYGYFVEPRYDPSRPPGESTDYLQGAGAVMDAATGDVLALVGGRDFRQSPFDRAVGAKRQVGSAFKPFVYAAALDEGITPDDVLEDTPLTVELDDGDWSPGNFDGRHRGDVTVRQALVGSLNVPTVRLAMRVGTERVAKLAEEIGMGPDVPREPSMALGTVGVSPLALTAAYTAFASDGVRAEPRFVLAVEGPDGDTLWRPETDTRRVLDPDVARTVTAMLTDVVEIGTGRNVRRAGFRGPVAGKTGTTNHARDVWFVGYTPDLVGTVWIGFDRPRTIVRSATGGMLAAPVWGRAFSRIYQHRPAEGAFVPPETKVDDPPLLVRLGRWIVGLFGGGENEEEESEGG